MSTTGDADTAAVKENMELDANESVLQNNIPTEGDALNIVTSDNCCVNKDNMELDHVISSNDVDNKRLDHVVSPNDVDSESEDDSDTSSDEEEIQKKYVIN